MVGRMKQSMKGSLHIRNGRIVDPSRERDGVGDLLILDGVIQSDGTAVPAGVESLDAGGYVVVPGLIDMHVHLRDPGGRGKESIASGTAAAANGGFTSVVCMPNTNPVADNGGILAYIQRESAKSGVVRVFPTGAMTVGLQGEQMTQIGELKGEGAVALTDDGRCIQNNELMRRVVQYAKHFGLPVLDHCEDYDLAAKGVVNEGYWSTVLGLPGISPMAEDLIVARDILFAKQCDWDVHIQHISTAGAVEMVRQARKAGIRITAEATPHHIALRDEDIRDYDSNFKMNPPLRTDADRQAVIDGIADGTITILATDHAPHAKHEKQVEFGCAPFGILGLETAVPVYFDLLYKSGRMSLSAVVKALTQAPAELLRLEVGTLQAGRPGDVTILDLEREVEIDPEASLSKSRNTPFGGWRLQGDAVATIVGGDLVMNRMAGDRFPAPGS